MLQLTKYKEKEQRLKRFFAFSVLKRLARARIAIIGGVIFVGAIVVAVVGFLSALVIEVANWSDWAAFQNINRQELVTLDIIMPYIAVILESLVVLFVFVVVAVIFLRKYSSGLL